MPDIREYMKNKKNDNDDSFLKKLLIHKVTVFYKIIIIIIVLIALGVGIFIYFQNKVYKKYNVISSVERTDTTTTKYYKYIDGILKCSNDGASYTDYINQVLWNQTFEMQSPMVDICDDYVAIADKEGNKIFIFNKTGLQSEIDVNHPIEQIRVADQGVVYTVLDDGNNSLIYIYDKEGNLLAKSKQPMAKNGYPLDISISADGEKLVVSYLYVNSGIMKSDIAFYNFGSVGQNESDNLVSGYTYEDSIFPSVKFVNETTAVAFGDNKVGIYKGKQRPEMLKEIEIEDNIKSIYYSRSYIGLVFENADSKVKYRIELYDLEGNKILTLNFNQEYRDIIIRDKEFILVGETDFRVYKMTGLRKFEYKAQKPILNIIPEESLNKYVIIDSDSTKEIGLKFN